MTEILHSPEGWIQLHLNRSLQDEAENMKKHTEYVYIQPQISSKYILFFIKIITDHVNWAMYVGGGGGGG